MICPYNATHRLFKHEMMEHIITCPMQKLVDPELYQRKYLTKLFFYILTYSYFLVKINWKLFQIWLCFVRQGTGNCALLKNKLQCDITSLINCNESWDKELESNSISHIKKNLHSDIR